MSIDKNRGGNFLDLRYRLHVLQSFKLSNVPHMKISVLSNLSLRKKFILLVGVPTVALLAMAGFESVSLKAEASIASRFSALAELSEHTSQALHELQKERGASAGYLGSRGSKFGSILSDQRKSADSKISVLSDHLSTFDTAHFEGQFRELLRSLNASLNQLTSMRRSVDQLSIDISDQVAFYTQINAMLLGVSDLLGRYSPTGDIANTSTAFASFIQSKERAGLERASLSTAFSKKNFTEGEYRAFTDLVNTQSVYLEVFNASANPLMRDALDDAQRDQSFGAVERMRTMATQASISGDFTVDPEQWFSTITQKIGRLKEVEDLLLSVVLQAADDQVARVELKSRSFLALVMGSLLISSLLGWLISRQVLSSINQARTIALAINDGYLDTPVGSISNDEVGELVAALGSMQGQLSSIVVNTQSVSANINTGAHSIHTSAFSLSSRTIEQSASLENTASSTEEISSTVRHNAERASEAQSLAHTAHGHAETGGNVVDSAVAAMNEITESSREIAEIISVIDDIAFQTNLLALNAAVEAARAGEQGRGFAVVASEVRSLAGRSAEAAREIKQLITRSVEKVESGSQMVGRSGETLKKIVASVSEVRALVDAMATAGQEQAIGVEGINKSMVDIDQITQKNSVMVEDMSTASEAMKQQTELLTEQLSFFKSR